MQIGDIVIYGKYDPRDRGFPLEESELAMVRYIYTNRGVIYAKTTYLHRYSEGGGHVLKSWPVDSLTVIEEAKSV